MDDVSIFYLDNTKKVEVGIVLLEPPHQFLDMALGEMHIEGIVCVVVVVVVASDEVVAVLGTLQLVVLEILLQYNEEDELREEEDTVGYLVQQVVEVFHRQALL